ncbi:uncharacterized protein LOC124541656 [Vanessa cardui]|uniref:uncharacterized protein LOC124541656 n=1 Tax=Vanessa cardui TaxID=171605 RepID=UPI001F12C779|nr:uncharacterized protein LOC124541656 [Vanessa cardui]
MDDTGASLKTAEGAAATRKRRSSILKSQRPPRTPFSELEFNVATPTDTAKSRRVSFSRRTGVAEFVTNEATTTWKNFYEEHNKSLESSGNESAANAGRQVIGHIGKRIFDQQFEEVEVVDIGGTLQTNTVLQEFQTSLNNVNLTQQLAALECTGDDRKLTAPVQNFDLSSFTDHHSKVFGDDLSIPVMNEMSNQININFSNLQPLGNSKCDDLDEMQRDLERSNPSNVVCQGPSRGRDLSEYIEIDLNMTSVGVRSDDCDMSITDTIQSPKVQEVVKTNTSNVNEDWVVDKENIVMNPYTTPKESLNFAVNEVSDEVLVFDGKKLTVQSEKKKVPDPESQNTSNNTQTPNNVTPKRKTIVLNMNDDLPNFNQDGSMMANQSYNVPKDNVQEKKTVIYNDFDLSITQSVDNKIDVPKRKTIVFEDDMGNISITQAVPAKVIIHKEEKRKTILYENDLTNLSITQAVPTNIINGNRSVVEKRKSTVYDDGDISFTRALPSNLILNDKTKPSQDKTVYFQDDLEMSVTQAIPQNIISCKVENIESTKNDLTNLSITQAIPCNIIINETKKNDLGKTVYYDNNLDADIETTQVVSDGAVFTKKGNIDKRKTIVYEEDAGNVSITQAIPSNIIFSSKNNVPDVNASKIDDKTKENLEKISVFDTETISEAIQELNTDKSIPKSEVTLYGDQAEISFTKVMPTNILQSNVHENDMETTSCDNDISITRALPTNILLSADEQGKTEPLNKEADVPDVNKTESKDITLDALGNISRLLQESKFHNNDLSNLSLTKPIPTEILNIHNDFPHKSEIDSDKSIFRDNNASVNQDIMIYQNAEHNATVINEINHSNSPVEDIKEISNSSFNKNDSIKHDLTVNRSAIEEHSSDKSNTYSFRKDFQNEEGLIERESLKEIEILPIRTQESNVVSLEQKSKLKKSILSELLDMSCASLNDVDNIEMKVLSENEQKSPEVEKQTSDSLFLITKDSGDDINIEHIGETVNSKNDDEMSSDFQKPSSQLQSHDIEESEEGSYLKQKVDELKTKSLNRHYEKVISSDLRKSIEDFDKSIVTRGKKSFQNADDTAELLEMLSDFTDGQSDEGKNKTLGSIDVKSSENLLNKSKLARLSFVPKRQSIAFSREDLLNNISMAQAALQQSRFEMDESGSTEDTHESPHEDNQSEEDIRSDKSPKKSVRMSTEVVKTLQFEDESIDDNNSNANVEISPLKKTAFGETAYMKEDKARVIPTYLKDVSDGIKALMHDLVKPMADVLPYETPEIHKIKKSPSTCSTQIQASLITSSQIDMDVELLSTAESLDNVKSNQSIVTEIAKSKESVSETLKQIFNPPPSNIPLERNLLNNENRIPKIETKMNTLITHHSRTGPVILFDHHNPLNNILLTQTECTKVHRYNPLSKSISKDDDSAETNKNRKSEVASVSMHYNVESRLSRNQSTSQPAEACGDKTSESISMGSNVSKPLSVNRSTEGIGTDVKHTEVNTVIAMKVNQELLQSNSSLTLVDDALAQSAFDLKVDLISSDDEQRSSLKVIYNMDTDEAQIQNVDPDSDDFERDNENSTTRKRSYSPTKQDKNKSIRPNVDTTPKPVSKMQKISNSPHMKSKDQFNIENSPVKTKSPRKRNSSRPEDLITVQQLISECYRITQMDLENKHAPAIESPSVTLDTETISATTESVTSVDTVSAKERQDADSVETRAVTVVGSDVSRINWQPEVVDDLSSKNLLAEFSSSANVVAKINTLSFMGRECEWESSGGDVWMFRLLRSRIRLTVRLAHSHHNASRSRVRADTHLVAVMVDPVQEESDPLAALCVRLAGEAMRYECSRAGSAADVPALLRRCAALARVALRWARAMRDARARLAYAVTPDGDLTLKVANVPLRAVWEVRLSVELVAEGGGAWPRAGRVRAASVLAGARAPSPPRLARLAERLPRDWGHAPALLWKVFKYLKNKTREDDLIGL